jgi:nitroreductase
MKTLKKIQQRNSARILIDPKPSNDELNEIYKAALRAPDHAWLRPTKFIQVMESGLDKLSNIFKKVAIETKDKIPSEIMDKYKKAPYRAPLIIIVVSSYKHHPKVPNIEQKLSSAAAAQNILLAADDLGYGAIWRTGIFAFNENINKYLNLSDDDTVIGYLYIGILDFINNALVIAIIEKINSDIAADTIIGAPWATPAYIFATNAITKIIATHTMY